MLRERNSGQKKAKSQSSQAGVTPYTATAGLQNLGNTCYMNSALQVLANLKPFHEYFVLEKMHLRQTNLRNPLAFQGDVVNAFALLVEQMWSYERDQIVPRFFKVVVGKACEQFCQFDQQDAQEFLAFCLDSLHEELNLRMKKPYIQNPESKNRDLNELGLEQWSNGLLRNWSIIYFLFYG